jgi:CTP:molybdopterin cytidylyltransferase MocA
MGRVAAVVLAAGEASRFGSAKQNLLLPRVLERLARAPVDEILVVEGAHPLQTDARIARCPDWRRCAAV